MKYSQATNYALHLMLYLVANTTGQAMGAQQLAELLEVSPTYLSKILTKLVKADLIESASGAHGGYRVKRRREEISFMDVIQAIEGTASLFDCSTRHSDSGCLIQEVMTEAEQKMEHYLHERKLIELAEKLNEFHSHIVAEHS